MNLGSLVVVPREESPTSSVELRIQYCNLQPQEYRCITTCETVDAHELVVKQLLSCDRIKRYLKVLRDKEQSMASGRPNSSLPFDPSHIQCDLMSG